MLNAVFPLLSIQFFFYWMVFFIAIFFSWLVPGIVVLGRFSQDFLSKSSQNYLAKFLLSISVGMILWAFQGAIFGLLEWRWLSYVYLLFFAGELLWHFKKYKLFLSFHKNIKKFSKLIIVFIVLGSTVQLVGIFPSGFLTADGLSFYQNHAGDSVMHISFMNEMVRQFPPEQPGAGGYLITNYHYWSDLVMGELSRVWGIPLIHLFFQYVSVFMAVGTGLAVIAVVKAWGGDKKTQLLALFFNYLGGDASYLLILLIHKRFYLVESAIDNGAEQLFNMPHAFAKFLFVASLLPLTYWVRGSFLPQLKKIMAETERRKWAVVFGFLIAFLVGFKVYYGMFIALGLGVLVLYEFLKGSRSGKFLAVNIILGVGLASSIIFFPVNKNAGGLYYAPLEWPRLMLEKQNLNYQDWFLRMQVYEEFENRRNIFILNFVAVALAFICIHGTRIIGFIFTKKLRNALTTSGYAYLMIPMIAFTFLGFTTLQVSGNFNVFNFFVVTLVILNISSAFLVAEWLESGKKWLWIFAILVLAMTPIRSVVSVIESARAYDEKPSYHISSEEYSALIKLREILPEGAVIQPHLKNTLSERDAYIALFANARQFATADVILSFNNQPVKELLAEREHIFESSSSGELANNLRKNKIDYLYLQKVPEQEFEFLLDEGFGLVYENEGVIIYDVKGI